MLRLSSPVGAEGARQLLQELLLLLKHSLHEDTIGVDNRIGAQPGIHRRSARRGRSCTRSSSAAERLAPCCDRLEVGLLLLTNTGERVLLPLGQWAVRTHGASAAGRTSC